MGYNDKSFNLLLIVLLVFLAGFFLEETIDSSKLSNYKSLEETFEIISELFSVFVALSIFSITWHAYDRSGDNHSLFLGTTFLITGLLTLCHLLSYPFMPSFITPNSLHKSGIFFLESRFIMAFLLLISVYVNKDSFPKLINKYVMVLFTAAILSVSLTSVWLYTDFLSVIFNLDNYSTETVFLLFLITIIILVTGYLYYKKAKDTFQPNLNYLANGSIIVLVSNLAYFSYEFSAHFLIITGFVYFYLGLYKTSVELPYQKLAISEEKLRHAAQEKYRCLFDNANDAIVTINMGGLVTSWNKSAEKLFGWTVEEITGKRLIEAIVPPETVAMNEKMINNLLSDTVTGHETACMRRDGKKIDVSVTISPLMDVNLNVMEKSLIIRDITERKKAEEVLRESEGRLKRAQQVAHLGNWEWDLITNKLYWAEENYRIHGIDPQKVKPTYEAFIQVVDSGEHEFVNKAVADALAGKRLFDINYTVIRPDNGKKCVLHSKADVIMDSTGKAVKMVGTVQDITERRQIEKAMQDSEARLIEAQRIARIGNWELNLATNTLTWSDEIFRIFEIEKERLGASYEGFLDAIHPEDRDAVNTAYTQSLETGNPYKITHRLLMRDGQIKHVQEQCETYYSQDGKPLRSVGIVQDITDRKQAQRNQELSGQILGILNESVALPDAINSILTAIKQETGFDAVGIRLRNGEDFPYFVQNGFSYDFLLTENTLTVRDKDGGICRDTNGKASLECTCGLVLSGKADLTNPLFTPGGSAWTNNSLPLLDLPAAYDPRLHPRNRCIHEGFCSIALIPVRVNQEIVGLLQLNDRRKDRFTLEMIEFFEGISASIGVALMRKQAEEKIKRSLEEKKVLLREIHHRVKNNMQIVSSLLMLQSQNIEDAKYKDMFLESQTRIYSMALIHEKLYQSESFAQINFKEYINGIVSNIFESYCIKSNIKIDINVENIPINIDYAVPCGLIINELVTNSLKYAFPDGRQGKIQISLKSNNNNNNMIQLSISDDGIGISKDMDIRNTKSLGLHLVTALAEGQLHGKIILNRERGTEFQIGFGAK